MTGDDIRGLAEDTELLTIIGVLSQYEDEMDSSQVNKFGYSKYCNYHSYVKLWFISDACR